MKNQNLKRKLMAQVIALLMIISLIQVPAMKSEAAGAAIKLNYATVTVKKGKTVKLKATVTDKKLKKKKIVWTTNKKSVATVTSKGVVKGKNNGSATITATIKGTKKKAKCKVIVGTPVTKITVTNTNIELKVGETYEIKPIIEPAKASNKKVAYVSSDENIVNVNNGIVTAKATGNAVVTIKAQDGSGKKAKLNVSVKAQEQPEVPTQPEQPQKPSVPETILATAINLSETNIELLKGGKTTITASVIPATATDKQIKWTSSDEKVATVDDGEIMAVGAGVATITATNTASGKSAACVVTVLDRVTVTTQEQLDNALQNASVGEVTLKLTEADEINIPTNNYKNTALIIDGNGAKVNNKATFSNITLNDVTYTDSARNNNILVVNKATVKISEGANASVDVQIVEDAQNKVVIIENNGSLDELSIRSEATVRVTGTSDGIIPTNISGESVKLVSNQNMTISATAKAELVFTAETDKTSITVDTKNNKPAISGVGQYEVNYSDTNEKEVIVADVSDEMPPVKIVGDVRDAYNTENKLADVSVYLISASTYTVNKLLDDIEPVMTDVNGSYRFDGSDGNGVPSGNYYIVMKKEGYKDAVQFVAASSRYNNTFTNETMELLDNSKADNGTARVTGVVRNAANKEGISGMTVELRKDKGNILGDALKTATTDSNGEYSFNELVAEQYTVRVVDNRETDETRFISVNKNACVTAGTSKKLDITVSSILSGDGIRFVLTWGSKDEAVPKDLDSHLFGPRIMGSGWSEVYFSEKKYGFGSEIYSSLDVDETGWNGPETTTIQKKINGIYYFYVYDYTDGSYDGDEDEGGGISRLSTSKASVDVYAGNELLTTYNVPSNAGAEDYWWKVCSYNANTGQITSYNTFEKPYVMIGDDEVKRGFETVIQSVNIDFEDEDDYCYLRDGYIEIYSFEKWDALKNKITFDMVESYQATLGETTDPEAVADCIITKDGLEIGRYKIYCYQRAINVIESIWASGETITYYVNSDRSQIDMSGENKWADIKSKLSFVLEEGYSGELIDAPTGASCKAYYVIYQGDEEVARYSVKYQKIIDVFVSGSGVTSYEYDRDWNELYIKMPQATREIVTTLTFTCDDSEYKCVSVDYDEDDAEGELIFSNGTDNIRIWVEIYGNRYIKDITADNLSSWYEYLDEVELYSSDGTGCSNIQIVCADGYYAIYEDNSIKIYDSTDNLVTTKSVYMDYDWDDDDDWEDD